MAFEELRTIFPALQQNTSQDFGVNLKTTSREMILQDKEMTVACKTLIGTIALANQVTIKNGVVQKGT
ncbi:MAG: hypothetical protein Q8O99_02075 [bacterium]|nr:hypothetical protein [bacterium]